MMDKNCSTCAHWGVPHMIIMRDGYAVCTRTVREAKGFLDQDEIFYVSWTGSLEEGIKISLVTHKTFYCSRWERKA